MYKFLKRNFFIALTIIGILFTFIPEGFFSKVNLFFDISINKKILLNRILFFMIVFILVIIFDFLYLFLRKTININGHNYKIKIRYGNLLKEKKCKKIISFDECFSTNVGNSPAHINPTSICGQYLESNPIENIQTLINNAGLEPMGTMSKYQSKCRYESGKLVPNNNDLLLSFAKLNESGNAELTYDQFLECLSTLWEEINKYYGQKDIAISILGSGVTRFDGGNKLTQQELLDIIILSYKLTKHKIKNPYKLRIVCFKKDDFSLNKIGDVI